MKQLSIQPKIIRWAVERSRENALPKEALQWINGQERPSLAQLEDFAKATHTPLGYLFLTEPPQEPLPFTDFRIADPAITGIPISANLIETIYDCLAKQDWYRNYVQSQGWLPAAIQSKSTSSSHNPAEIAALICEMLQLEPHQRECFAHSQAMLVDVIKRVEAFGVLVIANGVVKTDETRKIDVSEVNGFAIADEYAPLIFVNTNQTPSAQMHTLILELAHLSLGLSGISNVGISSINTHLLPEAQFCHEVAVQVLVPDQALKSQFGQLSHLDIDSIIVQLVGYFKVEALFILNRLLTAELIDLPTFEDHQKRLERCKGKPYIDTRDWCQKHIERNSRTLVEAIVISTLEGNTLYKDAFSLLGIQSSTELRLISERLHIV